MVAIVYVYIAYFCILSCMCTYSVQLSMCNMERQSRNRILMTSDQSENGQTSRGTVFVWPLSAVVIHFHTMLTYKTQVQLTKFRCKKGLPMLKAMAAKGMETRHKVEQVKAYLNAMQNPKNPFHDAVKEEKGCRLARGKSWMDQAEQSIQHVCGLTELKQVRDWEKHPVEFKPYFEAPQPENLGTRCRERPAAICQCRS